MAFLDFLKNRNATQAQSVTPAPQAQEPPERRVEDLPDHVKAQAVEAARRAAELMEKATTPRATPGLPSAANERARGRNLGMER